METNIVYAAGKTGDGVVNICKSITFDSIGSLFNWASCTIIKTVIPFLFALATAGFIWGIIKYFLNPDNSDERKKGKSYMIWGLIALFVMISIWGIVDLFSQTFQVHTLIPQLSNQQP